MACAVPCVAEANVDQVVAGGAIEAVVPLLTHFPVPDTDPSVSRCGPPACSCACLPRWKARQQEIALLAITAQAEEAACCSGEEVEKEACFILGLLAIKQEHQHAIADQVNPPGQPQARVRACLHAVCLSCEAPFISPCVQVVFCAGGSQKREHEHVRP